MVSEDKVFDRQPTLIGEHVTLRPLNEADWDAVFEAASDPLIWALHPATDRYTEEAFRPYFHERLASRGTLILVERSSNRVLGWSSYGPYDELLDEVEIGWTFLIRDVWGGDMNHQVKELMLEHAFTCAHTVSLRIAATNLRSRRATEKLGAVLTDRSQSVEFNGTAIAHVTYTITREQFRS
jgi:N-acetyltransferase